MPGTLVDPVVLAAMAARLARIAEQTESASRHTCTTHAHVRAGAG